MPANILGQHQLATDFDHGEHGWDGNTSPVPLPGTPGTGMVAKNFHTLDALVQCRFVGFHSNTYPALPSPVAGQTYISAATGAISHANATPPGSVVWETYAPQAGFIAGDAASGVWIYDPVNGPSATGKWVRANASFTAAPAAAALPSPTAPWTVYPIYAPGTTIVAEYVWTDAAGNVLACTAACNSPGIVLHASGTLPPSPWSIVGGQVAVDVSLLCAFLSAACPSGGGGTPTACPLPAVTAQISPNTYSVGVPYTGTISVGNATAATVSGLPAGLSAAFASGVITITGTPTAGGGTLSVTVNATNTCGGGLTPSNQPTMSAGNLSEIAVGCPNPNGGNFPPGDTPHPRAVVQSFYSVGIEILNLPAGTVIAYSQSVVMAGPASGTLSTSSAPGDQGDFQEAGTGLWWHWRVLGGSGSTCAPVPVQGFSQTSGNPPFTISANNHASTTFFGAPTDFVCVPFSQLTLTPSSANGLSFV